MDVGCKGLTNLFFARIELHRYIGRETRENGKQSRCHGGARRRPSVFGSSRGHLLRSVPTLPPSPFPAFGPVLIASFSCPHHPHPTPAALVDGLFYIPGEHLDIFNRESSVSVTRGLTFAHYHGISVPRQFRPTRDLDVLSKSYDLSSRENRADQSSHLSVPLYSRHGNENKCLAAAAVTLCTTLTFHMYAVYSNRLLILYRSFVSCVYTSNSNS